MARSNRKPPAGSHTPAPSSTARRRAPVVLSIPRRFLPPLTALSAFEAAARTGSITQAARELSLTQGAISRQISALEDQLEVHLFSRERQKIQLTPAGHAYVREIREGLKRIGNASMNLRANPAGGTLNVAMPSDFAAKWLVPRLPGFLQLHPQVSLNILTRESRIEFRSEPVDAAIQFGDDAPREVPSQDLCGHTVLPVCAAGVRRRYSFKAAADLRSAPLLHLTTWPDGWEQWLRHHAVPAEQVRGMLFDQALTLAAAAVAGMGVALLPPLLFGEELRRGELVLALDLPFAAPLRYRLAWPRDRDDYPPLQAFRTWAAEQLHSDRE